MSSNASAFWLFASAVFFVGAIAGPFMFDMSVEQWCAIHGWPLLTAVLVTYYGIKSAEKVEAAESKMRQMQYAEERLLKDHRRIENCLRALLKKARHDRDRYKARIAQQGESVASGPLAFQKALTDLNAKMLANSKPMPAEFGKVLDEVFWASIKSDTSASK